MAPWPHGAGNSNSTRTILSVLPSSPLSGTTSDHYSMPSSSSSPLSDQQPSRPVHRVNGRALSRKPDHNARSRRSAACPFRFRLAWWSSKSTGLSDQFGELCENCKANRGKKLAASLFILPRSPLSNTHSVPGIGENP